MYTGDETMKNGPKMKNIKAFFWNETERQMRLTEIKELRQNIIYLAFLKVKTMNIKRTNENVTQKQLYVYG